jgi:hypothetical protein
VKRRKIARAFWKPTRFWGNRPKLDQFKSLSFLREKLSDISRFLVKILPKQWTQAFGSAKRNIALVLIYRYCTVYTVL